MLYTWLVPSMKLMVTVRSPLLQEWVHFNSATPQLKGVEAQSDLNLPEAAVSLNFCSQSSRFLESLVTLCFHFVLCSVVAHLRSFQLDWSNWILRPWVSHFVWGVVPAYPIAKPVTQSSIRIISKAIVVGCKAFLSFLLLRIDGLGFFQLFFIFPSR